MLPEPLHDKQYTFVRNYEGVEWSKTGHPLEFNDMEILWVKPDYPIIRFYNKLILSENLQTIRTFFLTEVFTFFLYILGIKLYKFAMCIYRRKYGCKYIFKRNSHLKLSGLYIILSIILTFLLATICQSPTIEINDIQYQENHRFSFFKPYDVSQTYYHMNIPPGNLTGEPIVWTSNEIIEFSTNSTIPCNISSNSMKIFEYDKKQTFVNDFITKNLVSKNIQDIRLFLVTTILLVMIARFFIHMKCYLFFKTKHRMQPRNYRKLKATKKE